MNALILSCEAGGGSTGIPSAVKEKLEEHGHEVALFDLSSQKGDRSRSLWKRGLRLRTETMDMEWMQKYLEEKVFDVIITTHVSAAVFLSMLRGGGVLLPRIIYVSTDYTCAPFLEDTLCDDYVIPSQKLTAEFCRRGIPRDKILTMGIPVKKEFLTGREKQEAKKMLGLAECAYCLMFRLDRIKGRQVYLTLKTLLMYLQSDPEANLLITDIRSDRVFNRLERKVGKHPRITLLREVKEPAVYMKACDVVIAGAGGQISTEIAVLGTGFIQYLPGTVSERRNAEFFSRFGMSVTVKRPGHVLIRALKSLRDVSVRTDMIKAQQFHISQLAAMEVCNLTEAPMLGTADGGATLPV